jgi:predicted amino acid dehydrogenase
MGRFAFLIHPIDKNDVARKYPLLGYLPEKAVGWIIKQIKPKIVSHITGIRSHAGAEAEGWFVALPLLPYQFLTLPQEFIYQKIVQCAEIAEDLGAGIIGLGAFTSVVGDGGITVDQMLRKQGRKIAVTTGNSYTVATAIEGALEAAKVMEIDLEKAQVAVVGATGSIGQACAFLLAQEKIAKLYLVGRNLNTLAYVAKDITDACSNPPPIYPSCDFAESISSADIIITVTSAIDYVIEPDWLKPGAVVCDVARPRDISKEVAEKRPDVLVIEGGIIEVPGEVDFGFDFGFPPKTAYACMAETILLALEERYENFSLGKRLKIERVKEIQRLAQKHGFKLAGFRSFEEEVTKGAIYRTKEAAELAKRGRK